MKVRPISLREANEFVRNFHRHNGPTARYGGKFAIAAHTAEIIGVAIVGNPISATFMDGLTAEVLRVCIKPDSPPNANSFIYAACWRVWRAMGGERLVTYTLASESGASLRGANWRMVAEVRPTERGWRKTDHLTREWQPVMGQAKFRWEKRA